MKLFKVVLLLAVAVAVSVDDRYTVKFSSSANVDWWRLANTLSLGGVEARELRDGLIDLLGPGDRCQNLNTTTGSWSIGPCEKARKSNGK